MEALWKVLLGSLSRAGRRLKQVFTYYMAHIQQGTYSSSLFRSDKGRPLFHVRHKYTPKSNPDVSWSACMLYSSVI